MGRKWRKKASNHTFKKDKRLKIHVKRLKNTKLNFINLFTDNRNNTSILVGLKEPRVKPYDGIGDPDNHVSNFQWEIKMIPMNPKLWCSYFA